MRTRRESLLQWTGGPRDAYRSRVEYRGDQTYPNYRRLGAGGFTRLLDGVEHGLVDEVRRWWRQVRGIRDVPQVPARWFGHRLHAEAYIVIDLRLAVGRVSSWPWHFEVEVMGHLPGIRFAHVGIRAAEESSA